MGKYLICPDVAGLVLVVREWMTVRSEIDEFVNAERRIQTKQ